VAASPHDLVVEEMTPPVGFCGLPWWTRKPVVSIVQWFFFETWEKQYRLPFQSWMRCIAARNRYRWFIVQSEAMGRIIRDLVPGAVVRKIPCGLEQDAFISWEKIGNYALFLGRLDIKQKGLDLLLKAWVRLGQDKGIPLVIAGEGPDRKALEQEVKKAGIEKMVTFAGRLEGTKKREVLSSCRFLVMPSREETFGLTALEAMGISKPVVAFNIPHLNEIVQNEWGVLVEPFDTTAFMIAAHELWTNPDLCRDYGHRAYREALKYHWDILARRQEEFYLEVVEGQTE
jgi:glycosyltransferase involved in cell wall biosynthesis